jgi:hypothetical protein
MTSMVAKGFLSDLIEQTAFCLQAKRPRDCAGRRVAARIQFQEMQRAHAALLSAVGLIRFELAAIAAQGGADQPTTEGLSHGLEVFRAMRDSNRSWLELYGTTSDAIESIRLRSTRTLARLSDNQLAAVLSLARAACDFVETTYSRDLDTAGMAVTCDRLVEQGITSDADAFRLETLLQRFASAERDLVDSGARWSASFEAMASRLEVGRNDDRPLPPKWAPADWLAALSR